MQHVALAYLYQLKSISRLHCKGSLRIKFSCVELNFFKLQEGFSEVCVSQLICYDSIEHLYYYADYPQCVNCKNKEPLKCGVKFLCLYLVMVVLFLVFVRVHQSFCSCGNCFCAACFWNLAHPVCQVHT